MQQNSPPPMVIREVDYAHPDPQRLTRTVQTYYESIYGGPDSSPVDPTEFVPPQGRFFVGYLDAVAVAMGGWRFCPAPPPIQARRPAEIKRMYVAEAARGQGLARAMLAHLEESARSAGADALILETGYAQPEAVALYRSSGYLDIPRFGHYADAPGSVHLGKTWAGSQ